MEIAKKLDNPLDSTTKINISAQTKVNPTICAYVQYLYIVNSFYETNDGIKQIGLSLCMTYKIEIQMMVEMEGIH